MTPEYTHVNGLTERKQLIIRDRTIRGKKDRNFYASIFAGNSALIEGVLHRTGDLPWYLTHIGMAGIAGAAVGAATSWFITMRNKAIVYDEEHAKSEADNQQPLTSQTETHTMYRLQNPDQLAEIPAQPVVPFPSNGEAKAPMTNKVTKKLKHISNGI